MKAKQLILELKELVKEYGDQEVTISYPRWSMQPTTMVKPYDESGNGQSDKGFTRVKRFYIH